MTPWWSWWQLTVTPSKWVWFRALMKRFFHLSLHNNQHENQQKTDDGHGKIRYVMQQCLINCCRSSRGKDKLLWGSRELLDWCSSTMKSWAFLFSFEEALKLKYQKKILNLIFWDKIDFESLQALLEKEDGYRVWLDGGTWPVGISLWKVEPALFASTHKRWSSPSSAGW